MRSTQPLSSSLAKSKQKSQSASRNKRGNQYQNFWQVWANSCASLEQQKTKMSKESVQVVKRGDVASTMDPNFDLDEDHEMATLTAICIVGPKLRQNDKLVKDANAFGHKLLFSE